MNKMRELREKAGLNMREAAEKIGLPYTTYVNYEKSQREPKSEVLIRIADFFGVTVDYLVGVPERSNDLPSYSDQDLKFALWAGESGMTDAQLNEVKQFAKWVKERDSR